jgi:hypothetical protein
MSSFALQQGRHGAITPAARQEEYLLFNRDVIRDVFDAFDIFGKHACLLFLGVVIHEAAQLNGTFEGGDIHARIFIEVVPAQSILHATGDGRIVNMFAGAFMIAITRAAAQAGDGGGGKKQGETQAVNTSYGFHY